MSKLHDIKESKVWQEAYQVGFQKGLKKALEEARVKGQELANRDHVKRLQAKGNTLKEIAELLGIPLADVRRFARSK